MDKIREILINHERVTYIDVDEAHNAIKQLMLSEEEILKIIKPIDSRVHGGFVDEAKAKAIHKAQEEKINE